MKQFLQILSFLLFVCPSLHAEPVSEYPHHSQIQQEGKLLKISYLNHPSIVNVAMPIIQKAYDSLGINVQFIESPAHRLLQEIQSDHTDGDVIHAQEIFSPFPDIIKVGPPLTRVDYVLLCAENVPCDHSVLMSGTEQIVATDQSKRVIISKYPEAKNKEFYQLNFLGKLPELLITHRFNYAIYIVAKDWPLPESLTHLQMHHLFESEAYHILHKRHQDIADQVGNAIKQQLDLN